jgi:hypothetical protein
MVQVSRSIGKEEIQVKELICDVKSRVETNVWCKLPVKRRAVISGNQRWSSKTVSYKWCPTVGIEDGQ